MTHWPQYLMLALAGLSIAIACRESGKPQGPYNPVHRAIEVFAGFLILFFGGFFAPIGLVP